MRYSESFNVTRRIHLRPYQEIAETAANLDRLYPGIQVKLRNQDDTSYINAIGSMALFDIVSHMIGALPGSGIEVLVEGNFPEEILKKGVQSIGSIAVKKE